MNIKRIYEVILESDHGSRLMMCVEAFTSDEAKAKVLKQHCKIFPHVKSCISNDVRNQIAV